MSTLVYEEPGEGLRRMPRFPRRFAQDGNPYYPLPPDYPSLSLTAKRMARLNAMAIAGSKDCTPDELVWVWSFFRTYYLRQTPPNFFYKRFRKSAPFHYQMIRDLGMYKLNAVAAPRGFSKSTVLVVEAPMLLTLARRNFHTLLVLSKDTMVNVRMKKQISTQFTENEFILADFGELQGKRGNRSWNAHLMHLPNGSSIGAMSVKSSGLGERPDLILVDDVEMDPVLQKVVPELSDNYRRLLLNHFIPMLDEGGSALYQIGTLLQRNCFLYHMIASNDPQFSTFNRRLLDAEDDGTGQLLWPDKFSRERLEREKATLGAAAYAAQRRNRPGLGEESLLPIHAQLGQYFVEGIDDLFLTDPFRSQATFIAHHGVGGAAVRYSVPYGSHIDTLFRILTFDYAKCLTPTSDYRAFVVIGLEMHGPLKGKWVVLDVHLDRTAGDAWVRTFWQMARKWRVHYSGIEAVAAQETLVGTASMYLQDLDPDTRGWKPRAPFAVKYPHGISKEERIAAALGWRFRQNMILMPGHYRKKFPFNELYSEVENFTGMPGATRFDDPLDGLAMGHYMLKGRNGGRPPIDSEQGPGYNIVESLRKGEFYTEDGVQLGLGLTAEELTWEFATDMMKSYKARNPDPHTGDSSQWTAPLYN